MATKDKLLNTLARYHMLSPGDTVAVGCSGGADSMCLLSLLNDCSAALGIAVWAVHVNHGIRGEEADADERFVRDFCKSRSIPLSVYHADVPRLATETGESTELCARRIRYDFFAREPADKIATAHTASDAAETLLMNLARGSGIKGLGGIPPVRDNIIRPLIACTRQETEAYCIETGIGFVTDSTNDSDDYTRNRLRHTVIPALKSIYPAFESNALRCMELVRDDAVYLEKTAAEVSSLLTDPLSGGLDCVRLSAQPPAKKRRVLAQFFEKAGAGEVEARHILLLEAHLTDPHFALTLPGGRLMEIRNGVLLSPAVQKEEECDCFSEICPVTIDVNVGGTFLFGSYELRFSTASFEKMSVTEKKHAFLVDFCKIDAIINLRTRVSGDQITIAARGCSKTLKKLYNEKKIPVSERARLPVLADSRGVIFSPCAGVDASRLPDAGTKKVLVIYAQPVK